MDRKFLSNKLDGNSSNFFALEITLKNNFNEATLNYKIYGDKFNVDFK